MESKKEKLKYLNLGCGLTFHKDWINVDFVSSSKYVLAHNLLKGIPFPDNSFKVVYHSHILEHFKKSDGINFIKECYRVLQKDGLIRIAIPDLEQIAINYLKYLNESVAGVRESEEKYNWTMLELFDQMIRTSSGGDMIDYIKDSSKGNDLFLLERNGYEVKRIIEKFRQPENANVKHNYSIRTIAKSIANRIKGKIIKVLLGKDYLVYQTGKFRSQGEIHQWMYDRYSLKKLLEEIGFRDIMVTTAFKSSIPNWDEFNLDGNDGVIRKPDSLFIEARK